VVTVVNKFDFRLVIKETSNKWRPVQRTSYCDRDWCFWQYLLVVHRPFSRVFKFPWV